MVVAHYIAEAFEKVSTLLNERRWKERCLKH